MKKGMIFVGLVLVVAVLAVPAGAQDFFTIQASQDTTIYDDQPVNGACGAGGGQLANGSGPNLFAGYLEPFDDTKRALVAFDLSAIPEGATVVSAMLTLNVNRTVNAGPFDFSIHRLLSSWGEGPSNATTAGGGGGGGGAGDQAVAPDATWCERMFGSADWITPGGDFALPSDTITIDGPEPLGLGPATWGSTPEMVADVQGWVDDPGSNRGWIVLGTEILDPGGASPKRFDSREATDPAVRPTLVVGIEPIPVVAIPTLGQWGLLLMAGLLLGGGLWAVGRMR
ncbi:MAG: IPTL-CTERM sorting domain-containing protein [Acidobacteriota bacterium]